MDYRDRHVVVTGGTGALGRAVVSALLAAGAHCHVPYRQELETEGLPTGALNLIPVGQFDGGHISYAVLGRKSSQVTMVMIVCALALSYFSVNWRVWTLIAIGMLFLFGRHHPRTFDENVPLDSTRRRIEAIESRLCPQPDATRGVLSDRQDGITAERRRVTCITAKSA